MNPFDSLRNELVRAAAPRRRRAPLRGLAVALAGLSVAGTATAAIVATGGGEPSAPAAGPLRTAPGAPAHGRTYRIVVAPDLRAGAIGWCFGDELRRDGRFVAGGMSCGPAWTAAMHLYGGGSGIVPGGLLDFAVVPPGVASVEIAGRRVVPRADPSLPYDWRVAVRVLPRAKLDARFVPRDAVGRRLPQALDAAAHSRAAPVRRLGDGGPAPVCRVLGVPRRFEVVDARVATGRGTVPALRDPAFLTCATTTLRRGRAGLRVAVLVDAQDPRRTAAPLPRVPGRSARRVGRAWLVAAGGTAGQRRALLGAVRVRLPRGA